MNPTSLPRPVSSRQLHDTPTPATSDPWLAVVAEKVKGLQFGVVQIFLHDSKVVQIERTERTRFDVPPAAPRR